MITPNTIHLERLLRAKILAAKSGYQHTADTLQKLERLERRRLLLQHRSLEKVSSGTTSSFTVPAVTLLQSMPET